MSKTTTIKAFGLSVLLAFGATAEEAKKPVVITQAQMDQAIMESVGGNIVKPGSGRGKIVVINAQKRVKTLDIDDVFFRLRELFHIKIETKDGSLAGQPNAKTVKESGGTIAIWFVDRSAEGTTLLMAPEEKWAVVDVAALAKDDPTPPRLLDRVQKEAMRAFGWLCGCANSQYEGLVTGPVKSLTDLDRIPNHDLPLDSYQKVQSYLKGLRVEPYVIRTYMDACQEGWAPQPTNKWQKAIWDKVREIPTKPIQIKFDPKRDAGK